MTKQHMPEVNIMSMWNMKQKRIVIVMDEIEAMNSGDKGGINALTKLLRPKKTRSSVPRLITIVRSYALVTGIWTKR